MADPENFPKPVAIPQVFRPFNFAVPARSLSFRAAPRAKSDEVSGKEDRFPGEEMAVGAEPCAPTQFREVNRGILCAQSLD